MSPLYECDCCGAKVPRDQIAMVTAYGIETAACCACRGVDPEPDEPDLLAQAADGLERALRHERWGCSAIDYADQAVPLLRAAGRGDLADRLEDDPWGGDTSAILDEVRAAMIVRKP